MLMHPGRQDEDLETALAVYRRRIEILRAQAKEIAGQIAGLEDTAKRIERDLASATTHASTGVDPQIDCAAPLRSPNAVNNSQLVVKLAKEIISKAGRPLSRQEILAGIEELGHRLSVANPPKFVGKTLWAHPDFVNLDRQGYALRDEA